MDPIPDPNLGNSSGPSSLAATRGQQLVTQVVKSVCVCTCTSIFVRTSLNYRPKGVRTFCPGLHSFRQFEGSDLVSGSSLELGLGLGLG